MGCRFVSAVWPLGLALGVVAIVAPGAAAQDDRGAELESSALVIGGDGDDGIRVDTLSGAGIPAWDGAPALLIVAGLDATRPADREVARGVLERLRDLEPEALRGKTIYVISEANARGLRRAAPGGEVVDGFGGVLAPIDDDRDRRVDEDPPSDINGDGVVTMMRFRPAPGSGVEPTHVIDGDDPRVLREPEDGERATHALVVEGLDADGDGRIAEDGPEGVELTKNFPYRWPEFRDRAGRFALDQPETRAIAEFMLSRPNIVAVIVYGPHDTLVTAPPVGQTDDTGRVPLGLLEDDEAWHEELAEAFREATDLSATPAHSNEGSLHGWAYAHLGAASLATPAWTPPQSDDEGDEAEEAPAAPAAPAAGAGDDRMSTQQIRELVAQWEDAGEAERAGMMEEFQKLPASERQRVMTIAQGGDDPDPPGGEGAAPAPPRGGGLDDAAWLAYSDRWRAGEGFVAWTAFDHPELGEVEIGGFRPGFKANAPSRDLPGVIEAQASFVETVLAAFPEVTIGAPAVEALGGGVYRVSVRVTNDGLLPTRTAMGVRTARLAPMRLRPDVERDRIVAGEPVVTIESIEGGGGTVDAEWMVRARPGSSFPLTLECQTLGTKTVTVEVPRTGAEEGTR